MLDPEKQKMEGVGAFLGTWELIPEESAYELGEPPRSGTYRVSAIGDELTIEMQWTTPEGEPRALSYRAIPDGKVRPQQGSPQADSASMTLVNERRLDSRAFKDGVEVMFASRVLAETGDTMAVSQSGLRPDGTAYCNRSVYRRTR